MKLKSSVHKTYSGACCKVASDLGLGGGFPRVLWFPPPGTTGYTRL